MKNALKTLRQIMDRNERYAGITGWFSRNMPEARSELQYDSPFHLLIAVILSAQCTDKRVNMYTPALFRRFPDPQSLADASFDDDDAGLDESLDLGGDLGDDFDDIDE